jgi:uncharacterized NAD(P)/FAD-binding protein YdhS
MLFDLAIIGFGVIGVEALYGIKQTLIKRKINKIIKIAVIEKDLNNIPGGVAYSKQKSKFGYFNNPLRLSHQNFIKWFNKKKNKDLIINFSKKNKDYNLIEWLKKNKHLLNQNFSSYKEIYLPRLIYSFFLKDKIIDFLKFKKKLKIKLKFYKGDVVNLKKKKFLYYFTKKKIYLY